MLLPAKKQPQSSVAPRITRAHFPTRQPSRPAAYCTVSQERVRPACVVLALIFFLFFSGGRDTKQFVESRREQNAAATQTRFPRTWSRCVLAVLSGTRPLFSTQISACLDRGLFVLGPRSALERFRVGR